MEFKVNLKQKHVLKKGERKVQEHYRDWKTYLKTIERYLSSKNY
ncbi:hypothetical protein [Cytobacillus citreus]|nr:hypothetical protein [Cytobacillus citreus]